MFFSHALSALLLASSQYACNSAAHIVAREPQEAKLPAVTINKFDYIPDNGPLNWFKVIPDSQLCKSGKNQSPILLDSTTAQVPAGTLSFEAKKQRGVLENKGSAIEVVEVEGAIKYQGTTYKLVNFHFHTPSEHRINKEYYPIEVHFVTQTPAKKTLVFGIPIQLSNSEENDLIKTALAKVSSIKPGEATRTAELNFSEITAYLKNTKLYSYGGSLTTPPCSEGLSWFVGTKPVYAKVGTYNQLKAAVKYNSRIIQDTPGSTNVIEQACAA